MELGGLRIATVRGIPIRTHFTVLLALPLVALAFSRAIREAAELAGVPVSGLVGGPWVWGLGVAVALFASVLLHELAHSLYALKTGGEVKGITLLMIGGVSQLAHPPKTPKHEALMALVGPLVSLGLGGVLYGVSRVIDPTAFSLRFALFYLGTLNLFLGAFNLLPAFPMDGGRILRALLSGPMGPVGATVTASRVGKVFAVVFGLVGLLFFNMFLMLIAFFVWLGAEGELRVATDGAVLSKLKVADVMSRNVLVVTPDATVEHAAELMLHGRRQAMVVTPEGMPVGQVTLEAIRRTPPQRRPFTSVREISSQVAVVAPEQDAAQAMRVLGDHELAVMDDGRLVGTLGRDDFERALRFSELEPPPSAPPPSWQRRPLGH